MRKISVIRLGILVVVICTAVAVQLFNYTQNSSVSIPTISPFAGEEIDVSTPTIDSIFSSDHSSVATLSAEKVTTIIATGDIIPARSVNVQTTRRNDFLWPYALTSELVKQADITFINLETPLIENCLTTVEGMIFCGDARNVDGLIASGVDVASLANNHAGNHGEEGVIKTKNLLEKKGIIVTGITGPVYKSVNGVTFAFLGYNDITTPQPGVSNFDEKKLQDEIEEAKKEADVVLVTYHFGAEYRALPDDRQIELAHKAIDYGADVVIGNHPHWIQPVEIYKDKLITYAHGNFVFDQMWSEETKEGVVGKYTFYNSKLVDVEFFPVKIRDYGQPVLLDGIEKETILSKMKENSFKLSSLLQSK